MSIKRLLFLLSPVVIISCTHIDNYMLGKDNTPPPTPLTEINPKLVVNKDWSKKVGSSTASRYVQLSPVIYANNVYTANNNGTVVATNTGNSETLWQQKLPQKIVSGPYVSGNYLTVATGNAQIYVLDKKNGKLLWHKPVSNEVLSSPVISNGTLLAKTIDGNLFAFDVQNGQKKWVYEHGSPSLILKASSSPVPLKDSVILGNTDGKLDGVNLANGQLMWQRSIAYSQGASEVERLVDIDATPIVIGGVVYTASYQGYLTALSLETGNFLWKSKLSTYKDLAVSKNELFTTDSHDIISAFNRANGRVLWRQEGLKDRHVSAPVVVGNKAVVVADGQGVVHLLSPANGKFISRVMLSEPVLGKPAVKGNDIFITTANGALVKLSMSG
jgi:outer membrane protein assembly factor BamB